MKSILSLFSGPKPELPALQSLALVPDRASLVYHAGELVTGHMVITVNGQLDISQVQIALKAKAYVCIALERHEQHRPENKVNGGVVTHLKKDMNILDLVYNPATVYNQLLTTGRHDIGFSFMLPQNVPSSLPLTETGGIEYHLEASIQGHTDKNTVKSLTVLSNPVVNPETLSAPVNISNEKFIGLLNGKRLFMKCQLPATGWPLGSTLPVKISVENDSKKFMQLKCLLKQEITYIYDASRKKTVGNKMAFADGPQIEPRTNVEHTVHLPVPINMAIVQNTCPLISINYHISVKLAIPGSFDLQCRLPIILTQTMSPHPGHGAPQPGVNVLPIPVPVTGQQQFPVHGYVPGTMSSADMSSHPPPPAYTQSAGPYVPPGSVPLPGMSSMNGPSAPVSSAPYPTLDYGMPQPAYNPSVPEAEEAMPMPQKNYQYPQLN